ncbi:MAG: HU family DNA-binding protein [Bacteroidales bacterium]|nr:HU family DNA-binding protein [Bacteroidales bacterium]
MNKADLISGMAQKTGLTKVDSQKAINAFLELIQENVVKGESVTLIGFGTFSTVKRKARQGEINIQKGNIKVKKTYSLPAKNVVKFKVGKSFAEKV